MARYTGPKSRIARNSVKESLELTKFCQRRTILPDNMVIQEKEKLLNTVCNFVKSRKLNTPMEF